jgi:hypothetical protein
MNRRDFFSLSAGVALVPTGLTATEDIDECQLHADKLLAALKAKNGGEWVIHNDEMSEFILIRRTG